MKHATAIILFNDKKQILVQERDGNTLIHPNKWSFFGGGIEKNESPIECAIRECKEELSYQLKNPKFIFSKIINELNTKLFVFIENFNHIQTLKLNEGRSMRWISIDNASTLSFQPGFKEILPEIFTKIAEDFDKAEI
jgi:8-oxo-dGTP diphosphatase